METEQEEEASTLGTLSWMKTLTSSIMALVSSVWLTQVMCTDIL